METFIEHLKSNIVEQKKVVASFENDSFDRATKIKRIGSE